MSTEERVDTNTNNNGKRRRRRRRRKKNTEKLDDGENESSHVADKNIADKNIADKNIADKNVADKNKVENDHAEDKTGKKRRGYRKRRRKKKSKGEVPTSPRLDELLRVAESLQHRQQQMFAFAGRGTGTTDPPYSPFWFHLDASSGEPKSTGNKSTDEPKDFSWLAQRASMAGMGITPIDTDHHATFRRPGRIARVNSWGKHTTSLDPIYHERKGSNDSEKIRRLLSERYTPVNDETSDDEVKTTKTEEEKLKAGFSSTHLEQIFSPSWGDETEAWQRERLKQWVIWAEEQERTARVQEMYTQNDTVKTSAHTKLEYDVVCPYISFGCTWCSRARGARIFTSTPTHN